MCKRPMLYIVGLTALLIPTVVFAQAFGEYGRAVGSIPHGQGITGGKTPGGVSPGTSLAVAWARLVGAGCRSDWLLYRRIQDFIHGRMVKQKKSLN